MAKILVVEDNALNIKLFCDLLAAHGHQPEGVLDSREALEAARAFKPDLVITDIQLPHVSGLELMELIRKDEDLRDVPIMAVTAYSGVGDDERILVVLAHPADVGPAEDAHHDVAARRGRRVGSRCQRYAHEITVIHSPGCPRSALPAIPLRDSRA